MRGRNALLRAVNALLPVSCTFLDRSAQGSVQITHTHLCHVTASFVEISAMKATRCLEVQTDLCPYLLHLFSDFEELGVRIPNSNNGSERGAGHHRYYTE